MLRRRLQRLWIRLQHIWKVCEHCNDGPGIHRHAMTAYHWDGKGEDPNRPLWLCDFCWEEYRSYWQERWDEYYSGLL